MDALQPYLTYIYGVLAFLALLIVLFVLTKLMGGTVRGRKGSRLGISEYYEIDKTRRIVLVRRDDQEHLLLIGGEQDVVIETGIGSPLMEPIPARQPPRPPVFGGRRPMLRPVEVPMDDDDRR
jgi:Flagellar biosynthesis protein, FliO